MSCNYAEGLSPYEDKGVLGVPEKFENEDAVDRKIQKLVEWINLSKHVVVHTGAGISTAAGIPDFRGPNGVWTLEKEGKKPNINIAFNDSVPTKTHMALKALLESGHIHYIISQNIDGLHLRSGINRRHLAELHGNMFVEQCNTCDSQFVRGSATTTVGKKSLETECRRSLMKRRACRGKMHDTILDWEHQLPEDDLAMSDYHSSLADLNICMGTTLQIVPSGNLPLRCKKYGGRLVIINLQPTKHDKKADLIINCYVDIVMKGVMKRLGLEIPEYSKETDPTKNVSNEVGVFPSWNIPKEEMNRWKCTYEAKCRDHKKRKAEEKKAMLENKKIKMSKQEMKVKVKQDSGSFEPDSFKNEDFKDELKNFNPHGISITGTSINNSINSNIKPYETIDLCDDDTDDHSDEDDVFVDSASIPYSNNCLQPAAVIVID